MIKNYFDMDQEKIPVIKYSLDWEVYRDFMSESHLKKLFTKVSKDEITFTGILRAYSDFLKD